MLLDLSRLYAGFTSKFCCWRNVSVGVATGGAARQGLERLERCERPLRGPALNERWDGASIQCEICRRSIGHDWLCHFLRPTGDSQKGEAKRGRFLEHLALPARLLILLNSSPVVGCQTLVSRAPLAS